MLLSDYNSSFNKTDIWENHPDIEKVRWIQAKTTETETSASPDLVFSSEDEENPTDDENEQQISDNSNESSESDEEATNLVSNKFAALQFAD